MNINTINRIIAMEHCSTDDTCNKIEVVAKSSKPCKYQLDTSKFLKLMKDKHITCLDLQVYCNVYPETFKRFKENNGNITVNTLMKLVEGVEEILGEEFGNKFKYFEMKEKKKKK